MDKLLFDVESIIKKYKMLEKGDKIVAGISGGPDSMCMLHILLSLKDKYDLSIFAAHLNHQFRGKDADEDVLYVEEVCKQWGVPSYIKVFDVAAYAKKVGLTDEEAGRKIRYDLYNDLVAEVGGDRIAVAHNMNDQIETVLMNLVRGSGIEGLKGIEAVRGKIIRPLIRTKRADIEMYCERHKISARIDKTNLEPIYGRNKVRLSLIPHIEDNYNPNIMNTLLRLSDIAALENNYLEKESKKVFNKLAKLYKNSIKYYTNELKILHPALQRRIIRMGIESLIGDLKGIEYKHLEEIMDILGEKTGAAVILPRGLRAYISYENLILGYRQKETIKKYSYILQYDKKNNLPVKNIDVILESLSISDLDFSTIKKDSNTVYIDKSKIDGNLYIRNRLDGDVFSPLGLRGRKKLKDFFIDCKIPREERDNIILIADDREIAWVVGKRLSENFKITDDTKEVMMIRILL